MLDRNDLEALRNQVEQDYQALQHKLEQEYQTQQRKLDQDYQQLLSQTEQDHHLDIAAVEHLQRRFFRDAATTLSNANSLPANGSNEKTPVQVTPSQATSHEPQADSLVASLRNVLSETDRSHRKRSAW